MMNIFTKISLFASLMLITAFTFAQTTISGVIKDPLDNEGLIGANVVIKGTTEGTVTDFDGNFSLTTKIPTPFTVVFSYLGFSSQEVEITGSQMGLEIVLEEEGLLMNEVVVSASRVEERIMESPVTIEKMDPIAIKQASTADYYDAIANLKGVQSTSGSLSITSINTRGFGSISNTRFVQLMDGMDNAAPLLNFPTGNIVGISELDIHSVELIPGAASALYGANAFNGILLMKSKNPFIYQGFSASVKGGFTNSFNDTHHPYYAAAARYAKSFANDKLAFKVNIAYMGATDWAADDYFTGRRTETIEFPASYGESAFDGLNTIGDETQIFVPMSFAAGLLAPQYAENADLLGALAPAGADLSEEGLSMSIMNLPDADLRRTGFTEESLLGGNRDATSFKVDGALHYKITDNIEMSYAYRRGSGNGVYQGSERYALRDLVQQFHKFEVTGKAFTVRAYTSITDDGDSYNTAALGAFANEAFLPTAPRTPDTHPGIDPSLYGTSWLTHYLGAYGLMGLLYTDFDGMDISNADENSAHRIARQVADGKVTNAADALLVDILIGLVRPDGDAIIPDEGSDEFNAVVDQVREAQLPNGGGFVDNSRLYNVEADYNFSQITDVIEILVGGAWRQYDLFTDGTVFLEDPDGDGINERIHINEYGAFVQIGKKFFDRFKIQASARYDKNQNFDGQISPRVSLVYSAGDRNQHNVRASWQRGFRNPATQDQYIFFPSSAGIILGSVEENAAPFGLHNGGAYTSESVRAAQIAQDPSLLEVFELDYVQPEKLSSVEIGYKGLPHKKFLIDFNTYFNIYKDFIIERIVALKTGVTVGGVYYQGADNVFAGDFGPSGTETSPAQFRPSYNAPVKIKSYGGGLGVTYKMPKGFRFRASYSF